MTASILYPSITTRLRRSPGTFRHLVRSIVRALRICFSSRNFRRRENFFVRAKIWEKKVWTDAINSVQKSSKSEPSSRFSSRLKVENSLATFGRIQPTFGRIHCIIPPHSGTNLGTIGRIRQKVAYEILHFRYFYRVVE